MALCALEILAPTEGFNVGFGPAVGPFARFYGRVRTCSNYFLEGCVHNVEDLIGS